jgi:hypothetical protein
VLQDGNTTNGTADDATTPEMEPVLEQMRQWFVSGVCILLMILCLASVAHLYKTKRTFAFDQRILAAESVRVSVTTQPYIQPLHFDFIAPLVDGLRGFFP